MRYHWSHEDSLIRDVEFYAPHKEQEALIYAPAGVQPDRIWHIVDAMRLRGFVAQGDIQDGESVLRVSKFPNRDAVLNVLENERVISGVSTKEKTRFDVKKPYHFDAKQIGGAMQVAADIVLIPYALSRGREGQPDAIAALKWIFSYGLLALCGYKNSDKQTQYIFQDMQQHLHRAGFQFTAEDASALAAYAGQEGVSNTIERFFREHPVEINSLLQMSGGWDSVKAAQLQEDYKGNPHYLKGAAGLTTLTGNLVGGVLGSSLVLQPEKHNVTLEDGTVVQEKVQKEDEPHGIIAGFIHWVREKPLHITGSLGMMNNVLRIFGGMDEIRKYKKYMGVTTDTHGEITAHDGSASGVFYDRQKKLAAKMEALGRQYTESGNPIPAELIHTLEHGRSAIYRETKNRSIRDFFRAPRRIPVGVTEWDKALDDVIGEREHLLAEYRRIAGSKLASHVDFIANGVKLAANLLIASSDTKIDSDLKETGQLAEICNVLAHIVHSLPAADREIELNSLSSLLAGQHGIEASQQEIAYIVAKKLHGMESNPWERRDGLLADGEMAGGGNVVHIEPLPHPESSPHVPVTPANNDESVQQTALHQERLARERSAANGKMDDKKDKRPDTSWGAIAATRSQGKENGAPEGVTIH